ncbi:abortive infection family protein [Mobiluncus sp.]|uniref:abortive infection family protein n=1 Tax=Mobiluncus sp. TaxID=47293 RepID=UPI002A91CBAE|nr:abortive infection family protein [Mobiluncus sp.]MDY6077107.1 abortive infection family protein [Mobiluncus sp.]
MAKPHLVHSERADFLDLLNKGGYVLEFNNEQFDAFTEEVIGIRLTEKYGASKGKSLTSYLEKAPRRDSIMLLNALMREWDRVAAHDASEADLELASRCKRQLEELKASLVPAEFQVVDPKKVGFTSEYLSQQQQILTSNITTNPTLVIGTAKELIESCCNTILEQHGEELNRNDDLPKLVKRATELLHLNPSQVPETAPAARTLKSLLGSLATAAKSLAELRNHYGTGHGKTASYVGLDEREARLAAGTSLALVQYLWDTHKELLAQETNRPTNQIGETQV